MVWLDWEHGCGVNWRGTRRLVHAGASRICVLGWKCSSVVEFLPSMLQALGSIPSTSPVWWYIPVFPALSRQSKEEDKTKFMATLVYRVSSGPAKATQQGPVSAFPLLEIFQCKGGRDSLNALGKGAKGERDPEIRKKGKACPASQISVKVKRVWPSRKWQSKRGGWL